MIKSKIELLERDGINYIIKNGKKVRFKAWLGDMFSPFYDLIMEKSIFPKKLEASLEIHIDFLKLILDNVHNLKVLELASGSGNLSNILPDDNYYYGIDVSEGLLKIAARRFAKRSFYNSKFIVTSAEYLPLEEDSIDLCICNISLNFFNDITKTIENLKFVLKKGGSFICSVPIPERNTSKKNIRGNLLTEEELKDLFINNKFSFEPYQVKNGAIFYFKCLNKK